MSEIINFINDKGILASEPITKVFQPDVDDSIRLNDILSFVRRYNTNCSLVEDTNVIIRTQSSIFNINNGNSIFYIYNNNDVIEKWDPSSFSYSNNNNSLYCGLLAIIRPELSFDKTKKLISKIIDKPSTSACHKLSDISEHFFGRGFSYFKYENNILKSGSLITTHEYRISDAI